MHRAATRWHHLFANRGMFSREGIWTHLLVHHCSLFGCVFYKYKKNQTVVRDARSDDVMDRMVAGRNWASETSARGGVVNALLWKCRLKPALTGSCRPLSIMHCFLTPWFLRQIICLKKSLNYPELQKIVVLFRCFHCHTPTTLPIPHSSLLPLVSFPLHLFPSQLFCPSHFSLSLPPSLLSTGVSGRLCRVET